MALVRFFWLPLLLVAGTSTFHASPYELPTLRVVSCPPCDGVAADFIRELNERTRNEKYHCEASTAAIRDVVNAYKSSFEEKSFATAIGNLLEYFSKHQESFLAHREFIYFLLGIIDTDFPLEALTVVIPTLETMNEIYPNDPICDFLLLSIRKRGNRYAHEYDYVIDVFRHMMRTKSALNVGFVNGEWLHAHGYLNEIDSLVTLDVSYSLQSLWLTDAQHREIIDTISSTIIEPGSLYNHALFDILEKYPRYDCVDALRRCIMERRGEKAFLAALVIWRHRDLRFRSCLLELVKNKNKDEVPFLWQWLLVGLGESSYIEPVFDVLLRTVERGTANYKYSVETLGDVETFAFNDDLLADFFTATFDIRVYSIKRISPGRGFITTHYIGVPNLHAAVIGYIDYIRRHADELHYVFHPGVYRELLWSPRNSPEDREAR